VQAYPAPETVSSRLWSDRTLEIPSIKGAN